MNPSLDEPAAADAAATDAERAAARRAWIGFVAMTFGAFMAFLDIQVVTSSLNQIQAGLAATTAEIGWVQTAYLIAEVIAIPLSGYLSRLLSTRIYFTLSALGFTLASAACAMAWNIESMMLFRALQGFLGGGMIPSSFAALYTLFPSPKQRLLPQVLAGVVVTTAPTLGPVLGGYITELWSWHWLFLINLLPGLVIAATVWTCVRIDQPDFALWQRLDLRGAALMALFLGSAEWVLEEGPIHGWLSDPTIAFWAVVSVLSGLLFFDRVLTHDHPIIDLRPFRDRHFAMANLAAMLLSIALFATNYILPLYLGQIRGLDSRQIGDTLMLSGISMFLAAPFCARLTRRFDLRLLFAIGAVAVALGSWLMADLTPDIGFADLVVPQLLRGAGFMLALVCCSTLSMCSLPPSELKNASALYSLMRNLGGALGLAAINSVVAWRQAAHTQNLGEALHASRIPVRDWLEQTVTASGQPSTLSLAELALRLQKQVAVLTFNDALILVAWVSCLAVPLLMFTAYYRVTEAAPAAAE